MSMIVAMDEEKASNGEKPGAQLAYLREKKGLSQEHIAEKLHLRTRVIELLEADDYKHMPEPVFIKGYIRGYAKVLGVAPEPFLTLFNNQYTLEKKPEKALWQSRRESHKGERVVRLMTCLVAITAIIVVSIWWQKNKDTQPFFSVKTSSNSDDKTPVRDAIKKSTSHVKPSINAKINDLSPMQSMFSTGETSTMETQGG
jgi:cytoskeleton protein RodZ